MAKSLLLLVFMISAPLAFADGVSGATRLSDLSKGTKIQLKSDLVLPHYTVGMGTRSELLYFVRGKMLTATQYDSLNPEQMGPGPVCLMTTPGASQAGESTAHPDKITSQELIVNAVIYPGEAGGVALQFSNEGSVAKIECLGKNSSVDDLGVALGTQVQASLTLNPNDSVKAKMEKSKTKDADKVRMVFTGNKHGDIPPKSREQLKLEQGVDSAD